MQKKRWYILGCGIILLLVVAIIVIGLVAGLVLARRGGDSSSGNSTTPAPPPTTNSTAALSACGTHPSSIRRQVLTAAMLKGDVYIFARGLDGAIWYRVLSGSSSSTVWKSDWARWIETEDTFAGPPTAVSWTPNGDDRMHVFAPANNGKFNVLGAGYLNGSFPSTWQNLGEPTASAVALCHLPGGWVSSSAGAPDRIDQWVVNRDSRAITHDFWNSAIENFQEPATYVDWEASPSAQASASGLGVVCRRDDPIHTVLMFANGTDSVRFRHYTGSNRFWNPWVDIGGNFIGDPVLLPIGGSSLFYFFGINATGAMQSFYWTDAVGLGYRPPWTYLGGNFSSVPAAVLSTPDPSLRLDAVALGADGKMKHKGFLNQTWDGQWEDLGIEADSAPFLFQYEADAGTGLKVNRTLMAAIGADNQLRVAIWESASTKPWRELVAGDKWAIAGGNLTAKSMCD
ncbi:hypothetical protein QBC47DRAFT_291886 [Echria macrotheca]|uniref:Fucose-specific lectin n=1 Tax=Echria macrotheca TaxID=438768 RepID=A0AAJ0BKD8_9PEZI|nr:hypothetical protein QBC47DRAFT_291886 [Echria macrotheca]